MVNTLNLLLDMDVSTNNGTPKWMVKIMENPIKMDDLGVLYPYFWKHPYGVSARVFFSENTYFILVESRYNGA